MMMADKNGVIVHKLLVDNIVEYVDIWKKSFYVFDYSSFKSLL